MSTISQNPRLLMFLGTGSDVGKSITAAAFCRIFKRRGFRVAPFKAQNMSNNSYITLEGGEIGRAQVVQAEAAGILPSNDMNPVLLKPSSGLGSQVVVQGKVLGQMSAMDYHHYKPNLVRAVMESFHRLASKYEVIVMEGAGSCCEINLRKNDLVNFAMARKVNAPCVLVADIDRGGVFAQIVGSMSLLTPAEKRLTAGFIINKFRGDPLLFEDGVKMIEDRTKRPVFGVAPYFDHIFIDSEDSVGVQTDKRPIQAPRSDKINAAVIRLPGISNFTDVEILEREPDVLVNFLHRSENLSAYDLLILPGSKNCMEDAVWLSRSGWSRQIQEFAGQGGWILGLCGGYQLLGLDLHDPLGVESPRGLVKGLGLLPVSTTLEGDKVLRRVIGLDILSGPRIQGYEIHMGRTVLIPEAAAKAPDVSAAVRIHEPSASPAWEDGCAVDGGRIRGTYVHGLLDSPAWRLDYLNGFRRRKGVPERSRPAPSRQGRFHQYDRLADHFEKHVDVEAIMRIIGL